MCVLCVLQCVWVPMESKLVHWIPWSRCYMALVVSCLMWLLGAELWSSAIALRALNHRVFCSTIVHQFLKLWIPPPYGMTELNVVVGKFCQEQKVCAMAKLNSQCESEVFLQCVPCGIMWPLCTCGSEHTTWVLRATWAHTTQPLWCSWNTLAQSLDCCLLWLQHFPVCTRLFCSYKNMIGLSWNVKI